MICDIYVQRLIETVLASYSNRNDNFVFIKHYNVLGLYEEDFNNVLKDSGVYLLYHEYRCNEMQTPYEPFLDWVADIYHNLFMDSMTIDEFLDECKVYSLQKSIFTSYIMNGVCKRKDDVILTEVAYEKMRFMKAIISILNYASTKTRLFIVLNKLHLSNYDTIDILCEFIKKNHHENIALLATYNESFPIVSYMSDVWESMIDYIEINNYLFDWATLDKRKDDINENTFIPKTSDIKSYILKLNNMIHTFAIREARYYMEIIYQKIEFENLFIPYNDKIKIVCMYALICLFEEKYNQALVVCETIRKICNDENNKNVDFQYNYIETMAYIYLNQIESAYKTQEKCQKLAAEIGNEFIIFKAELLKYMIRYFGWNEIYPFYMTFIAENSFVEKLKKYGFYNVLAHMYVYGISKDKNKMSLPRKFESFYIPEHLKHGMEICEQLGNDYLLTMAYINNIDFYRGIENFIYIKEIYAKCIEIQNANGDDVSCADSFNGIGYNCSLVEMYSEANDYYNKALLIYHQENKIERMGETLYNMGFNCIKADDYEKGLEYVNLSIKLLDILGIQGYRMCKNVKLYGLAALCYFYLEDDYNCYMYLNKIERIIRHLLSDPDYISDDDEFSKWADDLFLYHFVMGVMSKRNEDFKESYRHFSIAQQMTFKSEPFKIFSYPILAIESSRLFRRLGREDAALNILNECYDYCQDNGYYKRKEQIKQELTEHVYIGEEYSFEFKSIDAEQILCATRDFAVELQLRKRMDDINFLSRWQDRLDKEDDDIDTMIDMSMKTIKNNFGIDSILYFSRVNGNLELIYSDSNELSSNDVKTIDSFFTANKGAFVVSRIEKYFMEYEVLINIFESNTLITLVGIPILNGDIVESIMIASVNLHRNYYSNKELIDDNNLVIMKYIFAQFVDSVQRLKDNKSIQNVNVKLEKIAATDLLTGLLNRQGFMNIIKDLKKDSLKTTFASLEDDIANDKNTKNTVLYIDLDNFKYYNDTVGHEIGDYVLVMFANILLKCIEKDGYAVRYGGDEFVLLLLDEGVEYGVNVAKKIFNELSSGFINEISDKLGHEITIDKDKMISCCIGIAEFTGSSENSIETALIHADEALYSVKRTTKHNYKVWYGGLA